MSDPIKRGDVATLAWDLAPAPAGGSTARVIISMRGQSPIVSRAGTLTGARVTITLTAIETAVDGSYRVEIETLPGPITYPNGDYDRLDIIRDLDPTA